MAVAKAFAFNIVGLLTNPTGRSVAFFSNFKPQRSIVQRSRSINLNANFHAKSTPTTLVVATRDDKASENMANALLHRYEVWEPWIVRGIVGDLWKSRASPVYLWLRQDSMLYHDHVDEEFTKHTGIELTDLIFVSRHQSSSGNPSLTVHPIGNPGLFQALTALQTILICCGVF
jgi:hypothetical protein